MDYEKLKEVIAKQIKENGQREITGPVLQAVLMAMVDSLGEVYPHTYTDEEKAQARANIDALSNHNGEITKEKLSLEVQAILNDVANKQNISDATLATIANTIVGAINEVYKGGLEDASIATSKIKDGAITEPKLDTDLINVITSAVQPAELASAIATALASYVAKADIVDTTGSATDKVMSQHGVTEAIDGVTNKVTELESKNDIIAGNGSLGVSLFGYYINVNSWVAGNDNYNSVVIAREYFMSDIIEITPHTPDKFARYAFLRSDRTDVVDFCNGTTLKQTEIGQRVTVKIPNDCKFIYLYARTNGEDITPIIISSASVKKNYDNITDVFGDINGVLSFEENKGIFNGEVLNSELWCLSDKLSVKEGSRVWVNTLIFDTVGVAFFDKNDNVIYFEKSDYPTEVSANPTTFDLVAPIGSAYFRFSCFKKFREIATFRYKDIYKYFIENSLSSLKTVNYHPDESNLHYGGFIQRSDGKPISSTNYLYTDYIDIRDYVGEIYIKSVIYGYTALCFYDKDWKPVEIISGLNIADYGYTEELDFVERRFQIPESAMYVRLSGYIPKYTSNNDFSVSGQIDITVQSIKPSNVGKKILIIGDSISTDATSEECNPDYTSYGNYQKWVADLVDARFFPTNIVNSSKHATGYVARYNNMPNDFITRIEAIDNPSSYDMVIVFGGINDFIQNIPLGTSEDDKSTYFVPAVDYFYNYLIEHFTQARIAVMLPMRISQVTNSINKSVDDYSGYIEEVAKRYCLPVLDLTNDSGFCPYIDTFKNMWTLLPQGYQTHDGVHPNAEYCQKYLAPMIKHFIEGLI